MTRNEERAEKNSLALLTMGMTYISFTYSNNRLWQIGPLRGFRLLVPTILSGVLMLHWSLIFLVVALIALALGAGGVAGLSMQIAWILFAVFVVIWVVSFIIRAAK